VATAGTRQEIGDDLAERNARDAVLLRGALVDDIVELRQESEDRRIGRIIAVPLVG
jgi:hypothetical protein